MIGEALVRVRRGAGVESEHRVAWATTDRGRGGRAHAAGGGSAAYPGPTIYARSAAKPFQALAGVRAGVPERFGLSTEHLAMACASHGGSDAHVERVRVWRLYLRAARNGFETGFTSIYQVRAS